MSVLEQLAKELPRWPDQYNRYWYNLMRDESRWSNDTDYRNQAWHLITKPEYEAERARLVEECSSNAELLISVNKLKYPFCNELSENKKRALLSDYGPHIYKAAMEKPAPIANDGSKFGNPKFGG